MNDRMHALAVRRHALVAEAAEQRNAMRSELGLWEPRLEMADRGIRVVQFVRQHPLIVVTGLAAVAAIWPTRFGIWLKRGWFAGRWIYGPLLG